MSKDKTGLFEGDNLLNQIVNISKAGAYDIVSKQVQELQAENAKLKQELNVMDEFKKWLEFQDVKKINKDASSTTFNRFIVDFLANNYSAVSLIILNFEKSKEALKLKS